MEQAHYTHSNNDDIQPIDIPEPQYGKEEQAEVSPVETNIKFIESILASYKQLDLDIKDNKTKIEMLQADTLKMKEQGIQIKEQLEEETEKAEAYINDEDGSELESQITKNKEAIQNRTCNTVIEHVEKIRSHITGDSEKAEAYIKPLSLSCKLLRTHVRYTRLLEETVAAFEEQKKLTSKQEEANDIIKMLGEHLAINTRG